MKSKRSFRKSNKRVRDDDFREKKIRNPRKDKSNRDFSLEEELEEFNPNELPDDFDDSYEEESDE